MNEFEKWAKSMSAVSNMFYAARMREQFKDKARAYFDRIRADDRLWK